MNRFFHHELQELRSKLILIAEKSNDAGRLAVSGFLNSDLALTEKAIKLDDDIDDLEKAIDRDSVRYITLRSPVSSDVRLLCVAIKAAHDLERAGDEAHSIAKKTRNILARDGKVTNTMRIEEMSRVAFDMMRDAITCFLDGDMDMAKDIIKRDREVDQINKENYQKLSSEMCTTGLDPTTSVDTILISKSIERIADHAKNLAEEVIYLLTGSQ